MTRLGFEFVIIFAAVLLSLIAEETFKHDLWPAATLAEPWDDFREDRRVHATLAQTTTFRRLALQWQRTNLREIHELRRAILNELGQ